MARLAVLALLLLGVACGGDGASPSGEVAPGASERIALTSPAFEDGGDIPVEFTCDGADVSPPLEWSGVPSAAGGLILTMADPDAGGFVHWIVFGLDPGVDALEEGAVPAGANQGTNSFGDVGYGGPCPPEGETHRYELTLYAVSQDPTLEDGASIEEVEAVLAGGTLTLGRLTGRYGR